MEAETREGSPPGQGPPTGEILSSDPSRSQLKRSVKRFELTEVHSPSKDATVDIVLVHGINGHPYHTWTSREKETFWPSQLLPQHIGADKARVLVFGYKASVASFADNAPGRRIVNHAETLVTSLALNREMCDAVQRPIIFIAHSLGGLVVKQALIYSSEISGSRTAHLRSVFVSTHAVLFLGTPHKGTDVVRWSCQLGMICDAVSPDDDSDGEENPSCQEKTVEVLKSKSETLQVIDQGFIHITQHFYLFFFHETKETHVPGRLQILVGEESAAPSIRDVERAGIHQDHFNICRFESKDSPGFEMVVGALHRYTRNAVDSIGRRWDDERAQQLALRKAQIKELSLNCFDDRSQLLNVQQREVPTSGTTTDATEGHTPYFPFENISKLFRAYEETSPLVNDDDREEDISWLVRTRAFTAWLGDIESGLSLPRCVWNQAPMTTKSVQHLLSHFDSSGRIVFLFDFQSYQIARRLCEGVLNTYSPHEVVESSVVIWCFFGQICHYLGLSQKQAKDLISLFWKPGQEAAAADCDPKNHTVRTACALFEHGLNLLPSKKVVLIVRYRDAFSKDQISNLTNIFGNSRGSEESTTASCTRMMIIAPKSSDLSAVLGSATVINENTEFEEFLGSLGPGKSNIRRVQTRFIELPANHWLWGHTSYQGWMKNTGGCLWIKGKPGSGKSVIAQSARERILEQAQNIKEKSRLTSLFPIMCNWFYSRRHGVTSHRNMLQSLIYQLINDDQSRFNQIKYQYRENLKVVDKAWTDPWTIDCLRQTLPLLANYVSKWHELFFILDGLDESEDNAPTIEDASRRDTLILLKQLSCCMKILILSRDEHSIARGLRHCNVIRMEGNNSADVKRAVIEGIDSLRQVLESEDSEEELENTDEGLRNTTNSEPYRRRVAASREQMLSKIKHYLIKNASGIILWVVTVIAAVRNRVSRRYSYKLKDIWAELRNIPPDIDSLYGLIVGQLANSKRADVGLTRRALIWVNIATSQGPFTMQELREALRIPPGDEAETNDDPFEQLRGDAEPRTFSRYVQRLCGPLLEIVPEANFANEGLDMSGLPITWHAGVQLTHETVREFLAKSPNAKPFRLITQEALEFIHDESLKYVKLALPEEPKDYVPLPRSNPLSREKSVETFLQYLEEKALLLTAMNFISREERPLPDLYIGYLPIFDTSNFNRDLLAPPVAMLLEARHNESLPQVWRLGSEVLASYVDMAIKARWQTAFQNMILLAYEAIAVDKMPTSDVVVICIFLLDLTNAYIFFGCPPGFLDKIFLNANLAVRTCLIKGEDRIWPRGVFLRSSLHSMFAALRKRIVSSGPTIDDFCNFALVVDSIAF